MDGLALLCNLFADGPVTLRRLRPHVADLATLERTSAEHLAEWIQCSVPQARTFAEEAAVLRHRIGEEAIEPDAAEAESNPEAQPLASAPPRSLPLAQREAVDTFAGFGRRPIEVGPEEERLPTLPETVQAEVRIEALRPLAPSGSREFPQPEPAETAIDASAAVRAEPGAEDDPEDSGRTLLRPGLLPGLDAHSCVRLAEHGVRTIRTLAEGAGLSLSRRTEIPYSRLLGFARFARAFLRGEEPTTARETAPLGVRANAGEASESTFELRPSPPPAPAAPLVSERAHDPFALPLEEPESAGPFG